MIDRGPRLGFHGDFGSSATYRARFRFGTCQPVKLKTNLECAGVETEGVSKGKTLPAAEEGQLVEIVLAHLSADCVYEVAVEAGNSEGSATSTYMKFETRGQRKRNFCK